MQNYVFYPLNFYLVIIYWIYHGKSSASIFILNGIKLLFKQICGKAETDINFSQNSQISLKLNSKFKREIVLVQGHCAIGILLLQILWGPICIWMCIIVIAKLVNFNRNRSLRRIFRIIWKKNEYFEDVQKVFFCRIFWTIIL